eukprot:1146844-Pelagomonas_calceolata.AAC.1
MDLELLHTSQRTSWNLHCLSLLVDSESHRVTSWSSLACPPPRLASRLLCPVASAALAAAAAAAAAVEGGKCWCWTGAGTSLL